MLTFQQILDHGFITDLQNSGTAGSLDAIHLEYEGEGVPGLKSRRGDSLLVTNRTGGVREAKVVANTPKWFVYREDLQWGQRIIHNISFIQADPATWSSYPVPSTILTHKRQWKGSPVFQMLRLRWEGAEEWLGEGLPRGTARGLTDMRDAVKDAWDAAKK